MKTQRYGHIISIFILMFLLVSCGEMNQVSPLAGLRRTGIQVLSTTNPYHGPNLLLAKTLEESPSLVGYFHYKGAPTAIEVRKAGAFSHELLLYYAKDYGVYVAKRARMKGEPKRFHDWAVTGPYQIGKRDYRSIQNFSSMREAPVFLLHGALTRFERAPQMVQVAALEPEIPLIARPKPKPKPVIKKMLPPEEAVKKADTSKKVHGKKLPNLDDPKFIPKNTDQEALMLSQGYAPRAPNGDVLHEIEGNAQTLANLASWYMGSKNLIPELQEANGIPDKQMEVRKGTVIRIPQRLIKRTKKMALNYRVKKAPE